MANLPNFDPLRPALPDLTEATSPRPRRQAAVSFNIASVSGQRQTAGSGAVISLPLKDQPQDQRSSLPTLPKGKRPIFSRHRHDANPALALKVLQDIQMAVEGWHGELKQTVQQIQALYMEGPIVDGWLETIESSPAPSPSVQTDAALLRHGDPQALSTYVERLCEALEDNPGATEPSATEPQTATAGTPSYRLCSLNPDGQLQSMPCPPEQVSTLSLAIARHQKLRQLLDQKRFLEAKLKRAVEVLTGSRDSLGIAPTCSSTSDPLEPEA
jgi:hypothetical protein